MINLILLFFLILGTVIGLRRGFILQSLHLIGTIGAFIIARLYYQELAKHLVLIIPFPSAEGNYKSTFLNMITNEMTFYNVVSFLIIFFLSKVILQMVATVFDYIAQLPLLKQLNVSLGALLGFIECYLVLFILLTLFSMIPNGWIQGHLEGSFISNIIVNYTPILSGIAKSWWENIGWINILN
ncbi:CvpA family protein [Macrococcoides caseolyticum]|uniref:CvpA family protein n=1 Tax=Macrococcoides caseolyticum TaxID=69966 RepID=UPI001F3D3707|nr:CvpA family protein [Macrococcus caseolyticus]MCE4956268.1 CvpA family protein [Macrococcus caseolyticus]